MRRRRAEWQQRVAEWRRSGKTAAAYAESTGVKTETLRHWSWRLGRDARGGKRSRGARPRIASSVSPASSSLVEVMSSAWVDSRFELELGGGRRVLVPSGFDADELSRLVETLERLEVASAKSGVR